MVSQPYAARDVRDLLSHVNGPLHLNYAVMDIATRSLFEMLCRMYPGEPTASFILQLEADPLEAAPGVQGPHVETLDRMQGLLWQELTREGVMDSLREQLQPPAVSTCIPVTWLATTIRSLNYQLIPEALEQGERRVLAQYDARWVDSTPLLHLAENSPALGGWSKSAAHMAALETLRGRIWRDIRDPERDGESLTKLCRAGVVHGADPIQSDRLAIRDRLLAALGQARGARGGSHPEPVQEVAADTVSDPLRRAGGDSDGLIQAIYDNVPQTGQISRSALLQVVAVTVGWNADNPDVQNRLNQALAKEQEAGYLDATTSWSRIARPGEASEPSGPRQDPSSKDGTRNSTPDSVRHDDDRPSATHVAADSNEALQPPEPTTAPGKADRGGADMEGPSERNGLPPHGNGVCPAPTSGSLGGTERATTRIARPDRLDGSSSSISSQVGRRPDTAPHTKHPPAPSTSASKTPHETDFAATATDEDGSASSRVTVEHVHAAELHLNYAALGHKEQRLVRKLWALFPRQVTTGFVLDMLPDELARPRSLGPSYAAALRELQSRIWRDVRQPGVAESLVSASGIPRLETSIPVQALLRLSRPDLCKTSARAPLEAAAWEFDRFEDMAGREVDVAFVLWESGSLGAWCTSPSQVEGYELLRGRVWIGMRARLARQHPAPLPEEEGDQTDTRTRERAQDTSARLDAADGEGDAAVCPTERVTERSDMRDQERAQESSARVEVSGGEGGSALDEAILDHLDRKLLRKLEKASTDPITVESILAIDLAEFAARPYVGRFYTDALEAIQGKIRRNVTFSVGSDDLAADPLIETDGSASPDVDIAELAQQGAFRFDPERLESADRKLLRKLATVYGEPVTVVSVIAVCPKEFGAFRAVGRAYTQTLRSLQERTRGALRAHADAPGDDTALSLDADLVIPGANAPQTWEDEDLASVERYAVDALDTLLTSLQPRNAAVARVRWGYQEEPITLQALAAKNGVTRERIRQIEHDARARLGNAFSAHAPILRGHIHRHFDTDLREQFPLISSRFHDAQCLWRFLEVASGMEPGSISQRQDAIRAVISDSQMDEVLASTPSPIALQALGDELRASFDLDARVASSYVSYQLRRGRLREEGDGVVPAGMSVAAGLAHVLASYPNGLHWERVVQVVNRRSVCDTPLSLDRRPAPLGYAPEVYLSGRGTYRHVMYFPHTDEDMAAAARRARDHVDAQTDGAANLRLVWSQVGASLRMDYHSFRYSISERGADAGLHFIGRSSVDTVTVHADGPRIGLVDATYEVLAASVFPLDIAQVGAQILNGNVPFAKALLYQLAAEGRAIRVGEGRYATAEQALSRVDTRKLIESVRATLVAAGRPVHIDVVKQAANAENHWSFPREFYQDAARALVDDGGWYVGRELVGLEPIPYPSLHGAAVAVCDPMLSRAENIDRLKQAIEIDDGRARARVAHWASAVDSAETN
jgi:hypothetical protein